TWMFSPKQINVMDYTMNASTGQGGRAALKTSDGCMISGVNDMLHENLISVSPNPTSGIVNFKCAMNIKVNSIVIQNVLGEEIVRTEDMQNDIFSLNLSSFPKGVYFATLETNKGRSVEKILLSE
ncbi:MAG: T9SS type A sorting domain-containing protein, partial [Bacteroidota bacterium]|nr:T9SS type A sorting domain-containing protein [Bacteroidota bacterium]